MKEYKIDLLMYDGKVREVVSHAIFRKAFGFGCVTKNGGTQDLPLYVPGYIYVYSNRKISWSGEATVSFFEEADMPEISASDFLALKPEDVKDDVIVTTEPATWMLVTQGESLRLVKIGATIRNIGNEPMNIEPFTRSVAERFLPKDEDK